MSSEARRLNGNRTNYIRVLLYYEARRIGVEPKSSNYKLTGNTPQQNKPVRCYPKYQKMRRKRLGCYPVECLVRDVQALTNFNQR